MSRSPLRWGACTDVGLVRRVNEDSECHDYPLFAVADGMGGHSAGDVASALAIKTLSEQMRGSDSLTEAVRAANQAIYRRASQEPELSGMGTTITALYAGDSSAQIAHVGDSRAYLWREGELARLTQDHTVVGRLVQQGKIKPEDADRHPQRSYLERALGVDSDVEVDVHVLAFKPGDRVLLCSDGLFGMIEDDLIASILSGEPDPQKAAERLCSEAVKAGGNDNVTSVVVDFPPDAGRSSPPAPAPGKARAGGMRTDTGPMPGPGAQWAQAGTAQPRPASQGTAAPPVAAEPGTPADSKRSKGLKILRIASVVLVVLVGGVFAARMSLQGSWYVGDSDGKVTIFSGVPGNIAGLTLSQAEEETDLDVSAIPEPHRSRLEEGITAESRSSAEEIVANLARLSSEPSPSPAAEPSPSPSGDPAASPAAEQSPVA